MIWCPEFESNRPSLVIIYSGFAPSFIQGTRFLLSSSAGQGFGGIHPALEPAPEQVQVRHAAHPEAAPGATCQPDIRPAAAHWGGAKRIREQH